MEDSSSIASREEAHLDAGAVPLFFFAMVEEGRRMQRGKRRKRKKSKQEGRRAEKAPFVKPHSYRDGVGSGVARVPSNRHEALLGARDASSSTKASP